MDFVRANNVMQAATIDMARFMNSHDVVLSPTLAAPPVRIGLLGLSPDTDMAAWGKAVAEFSPFTGIYNATGQPSMSAPLGMAAAGLPIGVMFSALDDEIVETSPMTNVRKRKHRPRRPARIAVARRR